MTLTVLSRPTNRRLLEPTADGQFGRLGRIGSWLRRAHPVVAALGVLAACYVLLAAVLIGSGVAFTHVLVHGRIGHWDDHVTAWFANHRSKTWNSVSGDFTLLANTLGIVVIAAVVTLILLVRRWGRLAALLVVGLAVELAVFLSTTYLVARPRPRVPHLGSTPSTFSWPSGHAAATLVLYGGIALLVMTATRSRLPRILALMLAVVLTVGVAVSRIYRGEHHPTDTLSGVFLGVGALCAAVVVIRTLGSHAAGSPAPGGSPVSGREHTRDAVAVR